MSLRVYFEEYKKLIQNHKNIKQNHKKFYIAWVELFLDYLEENDNDGTPKSEKLSYFTMFLRKNPKYQDWQINQAIDSINLFFTSVQEKKKNSFIIIETC